MNSISKQIVYSHQFFLKALVGTLVAHTLVGIPFLIGYLARFLHQIRERREYTLPQWNHWLALLIESWELLLILTVYAVLPVGLLGWFSSSIDQWLGFLWTLGWLPFTLALLISPIAVALAYYQYLATGKLESSFHFPELLERFRDSADAAIPLTLTLWGVLLIGFPIFGFTIVVSLLIYLPIMMALFEAHR